jgi:microcystin-dependent protein
LTDILSPPGTVPIGGVLAWLKSYTNTPALPVNFVECNGQVLADIASVYNGQTIPNLNSDNRFLRGNTISGAVGGEDTHVLIVAEMPSHKHSIPCRPGSGYTTSLTNQSTTANTTKDSNYTGGDGAHNNLPKYYEVVWIMRIK